MTLKVSSPDEILSRRTFLKTTAGVFAIASAANLRSAYGSDSDVIRVGVVGCGTRGLYDTGNCLKAAPGVEVVAMGDLFQDRLDECLKGLRERAGDQVKVTPETSFVGWDAYEKVLATDCNLVILTTPPHFRPAHFRAAVDAGKHVFMEKPVAVDAPGVRSIIETGELADQKNLRVVAGTQARRMNHRSELVKRIQDGQIGKLVSGQCIRTGDAMRDWGPQERPAGITDMEWQLRRWLFHTWLSGDFIAEMHIHELDITNWLVGSHPIRCMGIGGRQVRTDKQMFGDVYDHFSVEFEYPEGVIVSYLGQQIDGTSHKTFERIRGTKGIAYTDWSGSHIQGESAWKYEDQDNNPVIQQHADHIRAIRNNEKLNESRRVAESSLTAIMGRMSAYTGRELKWDWAMKASKLDLAPEKYEFGPRPEPEIAMPGKTPLT